MTIDEICAALIGKRLQTLYHGHVQIDWGEIINVQPSDYRSEYRIYVSTEPFGHYLSPDIVETLCRDGIAEKPNEYNKQYKIAENEE